jgi:hypothetical protein
MRVTLRVVAVPISAFGLSGGAAAAKPSAPAPATAVTAQADSDVGNDRPQVSYDGLMVRRRVVLAIHSTPSADLASLRKQLDLAAKRQRTTLSTISASTLDPADLARLAPDLVVALPSGSTRADAGQLMSASLVDDSRIADDVQEVDALRVLVHDLRFTVTTAHPAVLAKAIAREGILSDALGNYAATLGPHQLRIGYTGPLLGDHLVQSVRIGIARPAHTAPGAVTVSPRWKTGTGVDMSKEPAPAPAVIHASSGHDHGATPGAINTPSHLNLWPFPALGLVAALALGLLMTNKINRSRQS